MSVAPANTQPQSRTRLIRLGLFLIMTGLAVLTAYQFFYRKPQYQVDVFATKGGWGYSIVSNGRPFIYQATIPGQSGTAGFTSQEQARRVGERVVEKIQQEQALPTLTNDELRQLGVQIP